MKEGLITLKAICDVIDQKFEDAFENWEKVEKKEKLPLSPKEKKESKKKERKRNSSLKNLFEFSISFIFQVEFS